MATISANEFFGGTVPPSPVDTTIHTPDMQSNQGGGFLRGVGNVISSIEQPFASLAATPVQAGIAAVNKITGSNFQDPYANGMPGLFGSKVPISPLNAEAKAGDVLKAGATVGAIAAAPETIPGAIATGAGVGAATGAGNAMQQSGGIGDIAKQAGVGALEGGATAGALGVAGKAAQAVGESTYKFLIPRSMREAQLLQAYQAKVPFVDRVKAALTGSETNAPTTAADTAFNKGLIGTEGMLGVQAKRASNAIWNDVLKPKLDASTEVVNMPSFFNHVEQAIKSETPELSRQKSLIDGLNALREDYAGVQNVPLSQLQQFKEGWAQFIPDKAYRGQPIAGAFKDVTAKAADLARQTIYNALGSDAKQAYFDYGNLKAIQELGQKAMSGGRFKGGFGSFWSAIKDEALTPIATVGGRSVYRIGQGLEFIGKKGAGVLGDIIPATTLQLLSGDTAAQAPQGQSQSSSPQANIQKVKSTVASVGNSVKTAVNTAFPTPKNDAEAQKMGLIPFHQKDGKTIYIDPTGGVGSVERAGTRFAGIALSRIHPEDVQIISKFINGVRLNHDLPMSVERGAQALAEHWGINVNKSAQYIADQFENILRGTKKVASTNMGKFTKGK